MSVRSEIDTSCGISVWCTETVPGLHRRTLTNSADEPPFILSTARGSMVVDREDPVRLAMLRATQHDRFIAEGYGALRRLSISTVRDTIRWHHVEAIPHAYDFTSVDPYIDAANDVGVEVIWDLLHYGWPDGLDIY